MNHVSQLQALLNKYSQQELAELIGITDRTIQNYISENPTKPHPKTLRKIDEIYTKYILRQGDETTESVNDPETPYRERRLAGKTNGNPELFTAPLVPVKAQAGYVRAIDQATFIDTLDQYALPPGVKPQGAIWRYWEVEGDSMEPAFHEGDVILTSQVHQMDWENLRNFYLYVIVTEERVLFKRIYCKNTMEWVLISENEGQYPQQLLPVEYIKEVWVFRRSIRSKAPPTKEFKITV